VIVVLDAAALATPLVASMTGHAPDERSSATAPRLAERAHPVVTQFAIANLLAVAALLLTSRSTRRW
jgi:hypothetical protein